MRPSGSAGRRDPAHFKRVRACARRCASYRRARQGGKGIPNASGAETRTHRERPGAHGELRCHCRSRREPRRARSAGDPLELPSLPCKRGGSSPINKKPTTFFQTETKRKQSQSCSPPPPDLLVSSSDSSFPAGRRIDTQINKPQPYLAPAHRSAYIRAPTGSVPPLAPGGTKPPDPRPSAHALSPRRPLRPPPLTPTVPWRGRAGEAAVPRLTAGAPPSSRPPTGCGDGCSGRKGTRQIKTAQAQRPSGRSERAPPRPLQPRGAPARGARSAVRLFPAPHSPQPSRALWGGCVCLSGGVCLCRGGVLLGNCCSPYQGGSDSIARQFAVPALIALNSSLLRG